MEVTYERATVSDAETLIDVRNKSFYADYVRYGECPGYNISKEHMVQMILDRVSYKIIWDKKVIGNITVRADKNNAYYIGCLCIIPDYQNKGAGQKAIKFVESQFPDAKVWTLETPSDKERNIHFYKKMGYSIVKEFKNGSVKLVLFEKKVKAENK